MTGTWDLLPKRRSSTSFPRTRDRNLQPPYAWTAALGRTGRRYPAPDAPRADPTRRDRGHRQRRARWMDPGGSPHGAGPPAGRAPDRAPRRRDDPLHLCEPPGAGEETEGPGRGERRRGLLTRADLGEVRYGSWTGRKVKLLARTNLWKVVHDVPSRARFPGGESLLEVQHRMVG